VVCSALSATTKDKGTTNRLLQAYRNCLDFQLGKTCTLIQEVYLEHVNAAYEYIKNPDLAVRLVEQIKCECDKITKILQATRTIGHGTSCIIDMVISSGERLACFFISAVLCDRNIASEVIDLSEIASTVTQSAMEQSFYNELSNLMAKRIRKSQATVPVVTGFFGPIDHGVLTQIGRGYTDFCASIISVGLCAEELQVWKEVQGIFTADPSKVPSAKMLPIISAEEASELTFHGSEVIHYAAMRLATRASVSVRIKNVLDPQAPGTLIVNDWTNIGAPPMSFHADQFTAVGGTQSPTCDVIPGAPIAITSKDEILLINIRSAERVKAHSFLAGVFLIFDKFHLSIDLICTSEVQASMAVHSEAPLVRGEAEKDMTPVRQDIRSAISQLQEYGEVEILYKKTIISLVGKQVGHSLGVTGRMFSTLSENCIQVEMMAHGMKY